jgi:hypothetical protein
MWRYRKIPNFSRAIEMGEIFIFFHFSWKNIFDSPWDSKKNFVLHHKLIVNGWRNIAVWRWSEKTGKSGIFPCVVEIGKNVREKKCLRISRAIEWCTKSKKVENSENRPPDQIVMAKFGISDPELVRNHIFSQKKRRKKIKFYLTTCTPSPDPLEP